VAWRREACLAERGRAIGVELFCPFPGFRPIRRVCRGRSVAAMRGGSSGEVCRKPGGDEGSGVGRMDGELVAKPKDDEGSGVGYGTFKPQDYLVR
jgi:hypothetical protein